MKTLTFLLFCIGVLNVGCAQTTMPGPTGATPTGTMSEREKQALGAIKDMTSNLLFLATGVFALVGGYLSASSAPTIFSSRIRRWLLGLAFFAYGMSLAAGLTVFEAVINQLCHNFPFDPNATGLRIASGAQIVAVGIGSGLFLWFLLVSIRAQGKGSAAANETADRSRGTTLRG